jgi:hypothetical protein
MVNQTDPNNVSRSQNQSNFAPGIQAKIHATAPDRFKLGDDIKMWYKSFENYASLCRINTWGDITKLLRSQMDAKASTLLEPFFDNVKSKEYDKFEDWEFIRKELYKFFATIERDDDPMVRSKFYSRFQYADEHPASFYADLRKWFERGFKKDASYSEEVAAREISKQLINGIHSEAVKFHTKQMLEQKYPLGNYSCYNVFEAVAQATSQFDKNGSYRKYYNTCGEYNQTIAVAFSSNSNNENKVRNIVVEAYNDHLSSTILDSSGYESINSLRTEPKCYECGRYGHLAKGCWYRIIKTQPQSSVMNESAIQPMHSSIHTQSRSSLDSGWS